MSKNRWQQIEDVFHRAVELTPQARSAFLEEACGADHSLRLEVESLLAHESEDGDSFAGPARDDVPRTIAHYHISTKLGEGGMGAVYRATDTKLGREVAIKILPLVFAEDAGRMARFTREAKVLASLNHPHIAQIYGVEERALVMELVPGQTLQRPQPLETALQYARQIAGALEAAHEKGVVHRDLKPANIMITPDGVVKLLDFGLAAVAPGAPTAAATPPSSPAITGMILGTAAYMSPEQAAGKPVDKRSDIWSFGVVLWEMLTGERLFAGETTPQTLASVLNGSIGIDKLPSPTPAAIHVLLRRCLDRNVKNRLRDIGEARIAIESAIAGEANESAPVSGGGIRQWLGWTVAAVLVLGLAPLAYFHLRERATAPVGLRFQLASPADIWSGPKLSPDGRKAAYLTRDRLWVQSLESGEAHDLTPAAGGIPFWSADSRYVGYVSQGKLKKIEATGGSPQTVTELRMEAWGCGAWNQEDVIIFGQRQVGLFRVPASGGVPVQITALDASRHENSQYCPAFLPDGRHFVYMRSSTDEGKSAIYLGSVDATPEQQSSHPLLFSNSQPEYAPSDDPNTGYVVFVRAGKLMAQPFDHRRLELKGRMMMIADQVGRDDLSGAGYVPFSASANDTLVFPTFGGSLGQQVTWYDRQGKPVGNVGEPGTYGNLGNLELSPDGTRLALTKNHEGGDAGYIWLLDLSRGGLSTRFTFGSPVDAFAVWSPDGKRIAFSSNRGGTYDLYQKPANSVKDEELLLKSSDEKQPTSWSRDGRFLLYSVIHPKTKSDIWVLPMEGDRKPVPYLRTEFSEGDARFSPDGRWVAYTSDESGQEEVYVRPFSMDAAGTAGESSGKSPISNGKGRRPRWRADGRELYFQSPEGVLQSVEVTTNPVFRAGSTQLLGRLSSRYYDSSADGKRFLGLAWAGRPLSYTVMLHWQAGFMK